MQLEDTRPDLDFGRVVENIRSFHNAFVMKIGVVFKVHVSACGPKRTARRDIVYLA